MLNALQAVPAIVFLIGFPHFGLKPNRPASPADTLPPVWRSASRLAFENQLLTSPLKPPRFRRINAGLDPRSLRIIVDPDSGTITAAPQVNEVPVGLAGARPLSAYSREAGRLTFERLWRERSLTNLNIKAAGTATNSTTGLSFKLPSPLPPRVQSLLGPGGPALNVSGSENIRLSGQSDWTNQQIGLLGQRRSLFPTLNMQQDLDIRLEGQLSDRIKVNLLQNSANQVPLANRIAINYRGGEDDLVQALDLGNTSLTLPGTQYVSYSGRNEGLFGVKSSLRYGPLDFTILASKQEGKSERANYVGGSSRQDQTLLDFDYVRGVYYFLYDPDSPTLDIDDASITLYRDNANYTTNVATVRGRAILEPPLTPLNAPAPSLPDSMPAVYGEYTQLTAGTDYDVLRDVYGPRFKVIRMRQQLAGEQRLAVTYRARPVDAGGQPIGEYLQVGTTTPAPDPRGDGRATLLMKLLRAPVSMLRSDSLNPLLFDTDLVRSPLNATRKLELKNFYQLSGQKLDPTSVKIRVRQASIEPPQYTVPSTSVPYIELLGLDNRDETTGTPQPGHDGLVDGTVLNSSSLPRGFVDYENGVLFLPDPRPFAPDLASPFGAAVDAILDRRARLTGPADPHSTSAGVAENATNPAIYDYYNAAPYRALLSTYLIDVEFSATQVQGEIMLGRGQLLDGSEVVMVGNEQWVRDKDYTIDYDLGRLTLKRQIPPGSQLNVNYSYAPLFQQAGRTLVGSAFRLEGREKSLGGAFLYESRGAQDLRPRLGEEPSRSLITDLNTEWTFHPDWVTRLVDRLPNVRTTAPSTFHVQAEGGMSFPNPNTRNEVFVDDMEGVRDAVSLSMTQERWHWATPPVAQPGNSLTLGDSTTAASYGPYGIWNGETHWYSPPNYVKERDIKPNLNEAQGSKNPHQVLCLTIPRRPQRVPSDSTRLWAGIEYTLDPYGLDLSRSQFIELWVNDFRDHHGADALGRIRGRHVQMHVDLGTMSEDQMRAPNRPPNGLLETEDVARDNVLTVDEDTGLDGVKNADESAADPPDLVTVVTEAGGYDPQGDNFGAPDDRASKDDARSVEPRWWRRVNGTEGNRTVIPIPETEDQNLNFQLDKSNDYLEFTIDLGNDSASAPYLVTDVHRDYAGVAEDNGWRRYRIPIGDKLARSFGNPNLSMVQRVRVWLDGIVETEPAAAEGDGRPLLMIGSLDIVGSRWQQTALRDTVAPITTATLNTVNSLDNADVYVPPFDPGQTRNGSQELTRREQSLSLEFTEFEADSTLEAYKTFSLDEDYSRYKKLDWFATSFEVRDTTGRLFSTPSDRGLYYFVRFASDEQGRNYYEYRAPMPRSSGSRPVTRADWQEVSLELTRLSNLKLRPDFPVSGDLHYEDRVPTGTDTVFYVVNGRPSFTRLRRISIGIVNRTGQRLSSGQLWFDELRSTDVMKNSDRAGRIQVDGQISNLASYGFSWNGRGADFLTVGDARGTGSKTDQWAFNSVIQPHRFFEQARIALPVNIGVTHSGSSPRFTAGDDIRRTGELELASRASSNSRTFSTSYSRNWGERSNPLLRYTLGGVTANWSFSENNSTGPADKSHSLVRSWSVNYGIAPRRLLALGVPFGKARFYPLPERVYWNYATSRSESQSWDRTGVNRDVFRPRSYNSGRTGTIDFGADTRPFDLIHHHIEGRRNLVLPDVSEGGVVKNDRIGFLNFGRVVSWRQSTDARYTVQRGWLRPSFTVASSYMQNNGPELSRDLNLRSISNGQSASMNLEIPLDRLGDARPGARRGPPPGPPPGPRSRPDSLGGAPDSLRPARAPRGPLLPWRNLLAALGSIRTDVGVNRSSAFSRLTGTPSFSYLFGLSTRLDSVRTPPRFGCDASFSTDYRASANTRVRLPFSATAQTSFDFNSRQTEINGMKNRTWNMRYPDVTLDYGRFTSVLRLDRFMNSPQLSTRYGRTVSTEFANNHTSATGRSTSSEWRPLLGLQGSLKSGARVEAKVERRVTERENLLSGHSVTTDRLTTASFSFSRSYSQGQKVNILGKSKMVSSNISMGLTGQYELHTGETISYFTDAATGKERSEIRFPVEEDRLSVNGTGSYSFSTNVTGNLSLGYGQNNDRQKKFLRKNVRVELRAQFTF